jgi:hypothetical protein
MIFEDGANPAVGEGRALSAITLRSFAKRKSIEDWMATDA